MVIWNKIRLAQMKFIDEVFITIKNRKKIKPLILINKLLKKRGLTSSFSSQTK